VARTERRLLRPRHVVPRKETRPLRPLLGDRRHAATIRTDAAERCLFRAYGNRTPITAAHPFEMGVPAGSVKATARLAFQ